MWGMSSSNQGGSGGDMMTPLLGDQRNSHVRECVAEERNVRGRHTETFKKNEIQI